MAFLKSPGLYSAAAQDFNSGAIPFGTLIDVGLDPFISAQPLPNGSTDKQLVDLAGCGPGGRIMAALVLLATEPGLGSSASRFQSHCFCLNYVSQLERPLLTEGRLVGSHYQVNTATCLQKSSDP